MGVTGCLRRCELCGRARRGGEAGTESASLSRPASGASQNRHSIGRFAYSFPLKRPMIVGQRLICNNVDKYDLLTLAHLNMGLEEKAVETVSIAFARQLFCIAQCIFGLSN